MGFFDKIKGAVNAVTGGGATVTVQCASSLVFPGEPVQVRVSVTSTGAEIQSKGIFVDVCGQETIETTDDERSTTTRDTFTHTVQIGPAFTLAANQNVVVEGTFTLPDNAQPTFVGSIARHEWAVSGRLEAKGNDPESDRQKFRVGAKV